MSVVKAVVGIGIKGADVVLSQFKKIRKEKEAFEKPAQAKIRLTDRKIPSRERTEAEQQAHDLQKAQSAQSDKALDLIGNTIQKLVGSAAGGGSGFIQSGLGAMANAARSMENTAGKIGGTIGDIASGITGAVTSGLDLYKGALPQVAQNRSQQSMIDFSKIKEFNTMNTGEIAQLAAALTPKYGKIGTEFAAQLNKLYSADKQGIVQRDQANSLAQGDFSVLGNTKGWLLNKMMGGLGDLPPEIRQKFQTFALSQVKKGEDTGIEKAGARISAKGFDTENRVQQSKIVQQVYDQKGGAEGMLKQQQEFNKTQLQLVNGLNYLSGAVTATAKGFNALLEGLGKLSVVNQNRGRPHP